MTPRKGQKAVRTALFLIDSSPNETLFVGVHRYVFMLAAVLALAGCASDSVASRKKERAAAYAGLPSETKVLVDQGQIKVGMTMDAVYIAWGPPAQVLQNENQAGAATVWVYEGGWMEETRYWSRHSLLHDYQPRTYVRAEIVFVNGRVTEWHTLPQPAN